MTRTPKLPIPDAGTLKALEAYASAFGRGWKAKILDEWMNGSSLPELRRLRNTHGPSWLAAYRLPK